MSLEEFGSLTMGQWEALLKRRDIQHRYQCLYSGMVMSTIGNFAGKALNDGVTLSAFDFVPLPAEDAARDELRQNLRSCVGLILYLQPKADLAMIRGRAMESLAQQGYEPEEVEEIFAEMFPSWDKTKFAQKMEKQ